MSQSFSEISSSMVDHSAVRILWYWSPATADRLLSIELRTHCRDGSLLNSWLWNLKDRTKTDHFRTPPNHIRQFCDYDSALISARIKSTQRTLFSAEGRCKWDEKSVSTSFFSSSLRWSVFWWMHLRQRQVIISSEKRGLVLVSCLCCSDLPRLGLDLCNGVWL